MLLPRKRKKKLTELPKSDMDNLSEKRKERKKEKFRRGETISQSETQITTDRDYILGKSTQVNTNFHDNFSVETFFSAINYYPVKNK